MLLINKGTNPLMQGGLVFKAGEKLEVPDEIAKNWLEIKGVEKYIAPEAHEKAQAKAAQEQAKLEKANAELAEQVKKLQEELEVLKADKASNTDEAQAKAAQEQAKTPAKNSK